MLILAIDPGRTTGICAIQAHRITDPDVTRSTPTGFVVVTALEIPWEHRFGLLEALIDGTYFNHEVPQPPEAVVIENFKLRQGRAYEQAGSDFPSSQIIGITQAFLWMDKGISVHEIVVKDDFALLDRPYGLGRLFFQEPLCMSRVQIEPEHESWVVGSEHKKDAYKHARFYYLAHVREWRK